MATINEFIRIFGGKSLVILQQLPSRTYVPAKVDGQIVMRKQHRGRWKVAKGDEFVRQFYPKLECVKEELVISNNLVKALLYYAKKHPKVLEIAFLPSEEPSLRDDFPIGDSSETELPKDEQVGDSVAATSGDLQSQ